MHLYVHNHRYNQHILALLKYLYFYEVILIAQRYYFFVLKWIAYFYRIKNKPQLKIPIFNYQKSVAVCQTQPRFKHKVMKFSY